MSRVTVEKLQRVDDLEHTIHRLFVKGRRDIAEYLDVLQAINDGRQIEIVVPLVFLPLAGQWKGFVDYNRWLKENKPKHAISKEVMAVQQEEIVHLDPGGLLFYCHEGNVVLTAKLAWEYTCSYREKTWKSEYVRFEDDYMKSADNEPARPNGFYLMKRPPEDKEAIGRRFQNVKVCDVRERLGNNWGMGCEGLQFVGITHPHYPELMDGGKVPFIDLPALDISPYADGVWSYAPILYFSEGELWFFAWHIVVRSPGDGSGSLQQY